ncbi:HEAT repeat protein [Gimesia alba]|uniref:HEAT repeat protein n=1 Tax=Gimesia alba TaxID=2527973 RepID=A0A517RDL9_9PLAN|nr:HEAT repeat domain-containing protein [Gimesia alba]QDT41954.1 HEAT repeat protein [Gimesia alba]
MVTDLLQIQCLLVFLCCLLLATQLRADEVTELVNLLQSDNPKVRYAAARSLKALGPKARIAIKPLIAALNDPGKPVDVEFNFFGPRVQDVASEVLVEIGPPAVPSLIKALSHRDKTVRQYAAKTLGEIGPPANHSFNALKNLLTDDDEWVRWDAVRAVGKVGVTPQKAVPLLESVFRRSKEEDFVREAALTTLHDADPKGTLAIPLLVEGLKNANGDIVAASAQTLGKFHGRAQSAVRDLNDHLLTKKRRWDAYYDVGYTRGCLITSKKVNGLARLLHEVFS